MAEINGIRVVPFEEFIGYECRRLTGQAEPGGHHIRLTINPVHPQDAVLWVSLEPPLIEIGTKWQIESILYSAGSTAEIRIPVSHRDQQTKLYLGLEAAAIPDERLAQEGLVLSELMVPAGQSRVMEARRHVMELGKLSAINRLLGL